MAQRRGLGRGLGTLIPHDTKRPTGTDRLATTEPDTPAPAPAVPNSALRDVPVGSIEPNPNQPRAHFDEQSLAELADSIREIGVLQPLLVREKSDGTYQLIAGERRWRAAQRAKLTVVPVVVREVNELSSVEQALVENLHRQDLTPLEEASAYQQLAEDFSLTQGYLADGRLTAGHAKALLGTPDRAAQESLAKLAVNEGWSVRATEDAVRDAQGRKPDTKPGNSGGGTGTALRPPGLLELENLLSEYLSTKVAVSMSGKRGRVAIDFADLEDLERIYRKMTEGQD
jgi:ParB family chromosome partitioning protein